ncbi:hypothetical protein GCM10009780_66290 [Actinomadura alba]
MHLFTTRHTPNTPGANNCMITDGITHAIQPRPRTARHRTHVTPLVALTAIALTLGTVGTALFRRPDPAL